MNAKNTQEVEPDPYIITRVQPHELSQVVASTYPPVPDILESWRRRMERGELVMFAAHDEGMPIARVNLILDGDYEALVKKEIGTMPMVNSLGVNEPYRGRGIAQQLMRMCEDYVKGHPEYEQAIALGVEPDNVPARKLYEKLGYEYREVSSAKTYETSWPEVDESGKFSVYTAACMLMVKELST